MKQGNSLTLVPKQIGPPRLDPYGRLLARFYESLFFLTSLGRTQGEHTPEPPVLDIHQECRRRFLKNLSYICDFRKGGQACTAIAVEDRVDCYRFWVASNMNVNKAVAFIREILAMLHDRHLDASNNESMIEASLIQRCVEFAAKRIDSEGRFLRIMANRCILMLEDEESEAGMTFFLSNLLERALSCSRNITLCRFLYDQRHSAAMKELSARAISDKGRPGRAEEDSCFSSARHHIGRLIHHIRAPIELAQDSRHLMYLTDAYTVCPVSPCSAVSCPVSDMHTNLQGILNWMFMADDEDRVAVGDGLVYINKTRPIFDTFLAEYNGRDRQVHAEIQVLEHFYQQRLSFLDGDRYIACSKPACLCCQLYFKHHPARMVVPASHQNVYTSWSPPLLPRFAKGDKDTQLQKQVLSYMAQDMREQIIQQVLQRSRSMIRHPDSRTSLTDLPAEAAFGFLE
ncbi:hypothetical protein AN5251.2 [Aspergillus nidulans FGSC A4]|nr:hypothetical protein AN5251.2 [Aspergillus nidulans FGSC A4]|eukprot:XP_662855.1 hypothetical protein AN5251.2 [Aspergillus nidulans FGSC A4]